jgi:glycosyltransferase involved in cell wall biosynthesis
MANEGDIESRGYSVVVPVYNSETLLEELCNRIDEVLGGLGEDYEIILVDDSSVDNSWEVMNSLRGKNMNIKIIQLMRNFGQHNALLCGIREARYDVIITMDDDLQHPPEEIPKLLEKLDEGHDVIYGFPQEEQHGFLRDLASQVTKLALQSAMGSKTARNASAFRAFRTRLREAFADYESPFVSIDVLLTWGTTRFNSIPVRHEPREMGESSYTFSRLMVHALNMMTGFSVLPLQLASLLGFLFTIFGIGVLLFVMGRYLILGGSVPGFPFLASIIAIFSGVQLFSLGIIGEYLARMHHRSMGRPSSVIRKAMGIGEYHTEDQS